MLHLHRLHNHQPRTFRRSLTIFYEDGNDLPGHRCRKSSFPGIEMPEPGSRISPIKNKMFAVFKNIIDVTLYVDPADDFACTSQKHKLVVLVCEDRKRQ